MDAIQEFSYLVAMEEFNFVMSEDFVAMEGIVDKGRELIGTIVRFLKMIAKKIADAFTALVAKWKKGPSSNQYKIKAIHKNSVNEIFSTFGEIDKIIADLPKIASITHSNADDMKDTANNAFAGVRAAAKTIDSYAANSRTVHYSDEDDDSLVAFDKNGWIDKANRIASNWRKISFQFEDSAYASDRVNARFPKMSNDENYNDATREQYERERDEYNDIVKLGQEVGNIYRRIFSEALRTTTVFVQYVDKVSIVVVKNPSK